MSYRAIFSLLFVLNFSLNVIAQDYSICGKPGRSELVGKKFIPIPGCIAGDTYQTTTLEGNCTCWYHENQKCGYICHNEAIPAPGSETKPIFYGGKIQFLRSRRVRRQAACPPSPLPANTKWVNSAGCGVGQSYSTATQTCYCSCSNTGYLCTLTNPPSTTTTAAPTTPAPACPPNPLPANAKQFIADPNCSLLASTTTQAILIQSGTLACVCTSPMQCGMLCYSLVEGSNTPASGN